VVLSPMRAAIARQMVWSKQTAPLFYVTSDLDMTAMQEAHAQRGDKFSGSGRATTADYLLRGVAMALAAHLGAIEPVGDLARCPQPCLECSDAAGGALDGRRG
jgi:pyruvate/2-oxoglutarate dehydrogenase complex dihydrolipoamide acyltransferase (E2) component